MAEGTTRITGRTWRRIGGLVAAGFVIGALASSGDHSSPQHTTRGPSAYPMPVDVTGDNAAQVPAAAYERDRQAAQALNDASQQRYDALQGPANNLTP